MIWTADTVMYDGISMDRAYSGSTLIWCKTCPVVRCGLELVGQGDTLLAGQDYIIGFTNDGGGYMTTSYTVSYTSSIGNDALILRCDKDYPAVYDGLCEGYVTDLGAAFGIYMKSTGNRHHDREFAINSSNRTSLSAYIGHDWQSTNPDRNVIMSGNYGLQAYYLYTPSRTYNDVGFDLFPLNTGTAYQTLRLYRINYCYQS